LNFPGMLHMLNTTGLRHAQRPHQQHRNDTILDRPP